MEVVCHVRVVQVYVSKKTYLCRVVSSFKLGKRKRCEATLPDEDLIITGHMPTECPALALEVKLEAEPRPNRFKLIEVKACVQLKLTKRLRRDIFKNACRRTRSIVLGLVVENNQIQNRSSMNETQDAEFMRHMYDWVHYEAHKTKWELMRVMPYTLFAHVPLATIDAWYATYVQAPYRMFFDVFQRKDVGTVFTPTATLEAVYALFRQSPNAQEPPGMLKEATGLYTTMQSRMKTNGKAFTGTDESTKPMAWSFLREKGIVKFWGKDDGDDDQYVLQSAYEDAKTICDFITKFYNKGALHVFDTQAYPTYKEMPEDLKSLDYVAVSGTRMSTSAFLRNGFNYTYDRSAYMCEKKQVLKEMLIIHALETMLPHDWANLVRKVDDGTVKTLVLMGSTARMVHTPYLTGLPWRDVASWAGDVKLLKRARAVKRIQLKGDVIKLYEAETKKDKAIFVKSQDDLRKVRHLLGKKTKQFCMGDLVMHEGQRKRLGRFFEKYNTGRLKRYRSYLKPFMTKGMFEFQNGGAKKYAAMELAHVRHADAVCIDKFTGNVQVGFVMHGQTLSGTFSQMTAADVNACHAACLTQCYIANDPGKHTPKLPKYMLKEMLP